MLSNLNVEYDEIFIIDCLTEEQYNKWQISQELEQYLADNGIQSEKSTCRNKKLFIATLQYLIKKAAEGTKFCLHLISHGDKSGLYIETTDEYVTWKEFRKYLKKINSLMGESLIVNMTSCMGLHGIKIVDENDTELPFFGLIGYSEDLIVSESKKINNLFYRKLINGKAINIAVDEIKSELSDKNIFCISSIGYKTIRNTLNKNN